MARYNEILTGRFNRALQKFLSMKGEPPAPQLASDIQASLPLFWGVECRYLEGWYRYGVTAVVAAGGAGNRAAVRMTLRPNSAMVAVLEKATVAAPIADAPFLTVSTLGSPDLAGTVIVTNTALDNRGQQSPQMVITSSGNAGAVLGVQIDQASLGVNTNYEFVQTDDQELTILPGSSYTLYSNVLNQGVTFSIRWRERTLEESERS